MEAGKKLDPYYDAICMNTKTAAATGLKDGQTVWVESQYGKTKGRLKVSELFHPETVGMAGALGRRVKTLGAGPSDRAQYNELPDASMEQMDWIAGGIENTVRVKVYAA